MTERNNYCFFDIRNSFADNKISVTYLSEEPFLIEEFEN